MKVQHTLPYSILATSANCCVVPQACCFWFAMGFGNNPLCSTTPASLGRTRSQRPVLCSMTSQPLQPLQSPLPAPVKLVARGQCPQAVVLHDTSTTAVTAITIASGHNRSSAPQYNVTAKIRRPLRSATPSSSGLIRSQRPMSASCCAA